jgi:23S rRNA (guanine745-N1)-methyltransferase
VLVDAGCGEGYYTVSLAQDFEYTYGFDLSRSSVQTAAKRARAAGLGERCFFGVSSVYSMPIADASADCVTNVFAPCAEEEYSRILKEGGILVLACAGVHHLEGLKAVLYDAVRENSDRADLPKRLTLIERKNVSYEITLSSPEQIRDLYMMTPYCYKTSIEAQKKLLALDSLTTVVDFDIYVYRK